jgi:rhodanese-related sulfurtransferase
VTVVYDRKTGTILGGQTAGYEGADKRLDVLATATASKLTVHDLADVDFAYSPPIGTANDALNMAAYVAENKLSGYSPSVTVAELDALIASKNPVFIDVRDVFAYERAHLKGAQHQPLETLGRLLGEIPSDRTLVVYDETGKKGHQALRQLVGAGFKDVVNVSGGHISLQRHARAVGFTQLEIGLLPIEKKTVIQEHASKVVEDAPAKVETPKVETPGSAIVVDVRTPEEFRTGAYPGATNIPLDALAQRSEELGTDSSRDITVYCASGARSAYAERLLRSLGYNNVKNGGGIAAMMSRRSHEKAPEAANAPLIVDVRTWQEFSNGAFPGAVNIPLDELQARLDELGSRSRDITVYCASGARSSYAQQLLAAQGFSRVKNGGGIVQMMATRS